MLEQSDYKNLFLINILSSIVFLFIVGIGLMFYIFGNSNIARLYFSIIILLILIKFNMKREVKK